MYVIWQNSLNGKILYLISRLSQLHFQFPDSSREHWNLSIQLILIVLNPLKLLDNYSVQCTQVWMIMVMYVVARAKITMCMLIYMYFYSMGVWYCLQLDWIENLVPPGLMISPVWSTSLSEQHSLLISAQKLIVYSWQQERGKSFQTRTKVINVLSLHILSRYNYSWS